MDPSGVPSVRSSPGSRPGPLGLDPHGPGGTTDWGTQVREATWSQTVGEPMAAPPAAAAPTARPPKQVKEDWVEIQVVDGEGRPVVGHAYKLELPDGKVVEGKLGSSGVISVNAIDPGNVTLSFPELDARAWSLG